MIKEFEMTDDQLSALMDACKATPVMFLSGGKPMFNSPQENANHAWKLLGDELGFKHMTVMPCGKGNKFFNNALINSASLLSKISVRVVKFSKNSDCKSLRVISHLSATCLILFTNLDVKRLIIFASSALITLEEFGEYQKAGSVNLTPKVGFCLR